MKIKELIKNSYETSKSKGFHDINDKLIKNIKSEEDKKALNDLIITQKLMLISSEVVEAMESIRKNRYTKMSKSEINTLLLEHDSKYVSLFEKTVKDTFEDEIADVFIRLGDLCGKFNIDINNHIKLKQRYNKTREKMHGKNF